MTSPVRSTRRSWWPLAVTALSVAAIVVALIWRFPPSPDSPTIITRVDSVQVTRPDHLAEMARLEGVVDSLARAERRLRGQLANSRAVVDSMRGTILDLYDVLADAEPSCRPVLDQMRSACEAALDTAQMRLAGMADRADLAGERGDSLARIAAARGSRLTVVEALVDSLMASRKDRGAGGILARLMPAVWAGVTLNQHGAGLGGGLGWRVPLPR